MNNQRIEEIREFLNQPDVVYEEAPMIALELLEIVDELQFLMRWTKPTEHTPQKCERVLIRYEDEREVRYVVAWYDAGMWWLSAKHTLSRYYDRVTHWTTIEPPIDVLVDIGLAK